LQISYFHLVCIFIYTIIQPIGDVKRKALKKRKEKDQVARGLINRSKNKGTISLSCVIIRNQRSVVQIHSPAPDKNVDFKLVFEKLLTAFKEADIRYALMGGFAMGIWGVPRATVDLYFLVHRDDIDKVHRIMTAMGYELDHHSENVSQYVSPLKIFGGIDFIHAFRDASLETLQRAVFKDIYNGAMKVKTLIPEDIIGFKLQAIYNNPSREKIDTTDIETLISLYHKNLDRELLKKYFNLFEMENLYKYLVEGEKK
jgi:hypothetical protein